MATARLHWRQASAWLPSRTCLSRIPEPMHARERVIRRAYSSAVQEMTPVEKIVRDSIKATGPISFATYMQLCLSHPIEGYYMNGSNAVFGKQGDFITSPEISQVFGELLGIWLLSQYVVAGASRKIRLVELGPGRGTLMADILRVLSFLPASKGAIHEVRLVETSPSMRKMQETSLGHLCESKSVKLGWSDSLDDIAKDDSVYTMIVAHEFFDALPVHVLQKTAQGWHEIFIDASLDPASKTIIKSSDLSSLAANSSPLSSSLSPLPNIAKPLVQPSPSSTSPLPSDIAAGPPAPLRRVLSRAPSTVSKLLGLSSPRFAGLPEGSRLEVSPASFKVARKVGELVSRPKEGEKKLDAGCALIVDYGADKAFGDSLRAFKQHKIVDIFHQPGRCDLTANTDFAYLKESLADIALSHGPLSQRDFLTRMGIDLRVDKLKRTAATEERKQEIEKAAKRLVDPTGMGTQYQIMGVTGARDSPEGEERTGPWPFV